MKNLFNKIKEFFSALRTNGELRNQIFQLKTELDINRTLVEINDLHIKAQERRLKRAHLEIEQLNKMVKVKKGKSK